MASLKVPEIPDIKDPIVTFPYESIFTTGLPSAYIYLFKLRGLSSKPIHVSCWLNLAVCGS